jgi:hypothetical protein
VQAVRWRAQERRNTLSPPHLLTCMDVGAPAAAGGAGSEARRYSFSAWKKRTVRWTGKGRG